MQSHKLTIADSWFIEKGQVDTITRSPFAVGDEVVVCDKKHVSLLECYDGECPVTNCHSKVTVQFNRANVEYEEFKLYSFTGECPKCQRIITTLYKQSRGVCSGKCPICGQIITVPINYFQLQAKKYTMQRNVHRLSIALWCIFVVMVIGIGVLTCADIIKHQPALDFFNSVMIPKSMELIDKSQDFIVSDEFIFCLKESSQQLINKNSVLFGNAVAVLLFLGLNLKTFGISFWMKTLDTYQKTSELFLQVTDRTKWLIDTIILWINKIVSRF